MNFAALETVVNASVLQHLANARVRIDGGEEVPGVFNNPSSVAALGVGVADTCPTVSVGSSSVPADPVGRAIAIDGVAYAIVRDDPDGAGMTLLTVELAQ
jgi:hypothetical protein